MDLAKSKKKQQRGRKRLSLTKIIFVLVFVWFIGNSLINFFTGLFVNTLTARVEVVEDKYSGQGYIIRDEVLIISPATGELKNQISAGQRVAKGAAISEISISEGTVLETGQSITITAPKAGVVSYITDGLETYFEPNKIQTYNIDKVEQIKKETVDNTKITMLEKGERYCKVVNNLQGLQIYMEFPLDLFAEPLEKGEKLSLQLPDIQKETEAVIADLRGIGNTARVLLEIPEAWYELLNTRAQTVEIILKKQEGISIPRGALVEDDQKGVGVYCLRKGFVYWESVEILAEKNGKVFINGVEPLTEIVLNPHLVNEGQYLY